MDPEHKHAIFNRGGAAAQRFSQTQASFGSRAEVDQRTDVGKGQLLCLCLQQTLLLFLLI